jgi:hypothetical protein
MTMHHVHRPTVTRWLGSMLIGSLAVVLITSVVPGTAWGRVRIGVVVPFGPYVVPYPYAYPYPYPPVVVQAPPTVYVQPAPQTPTWGSRRYRWGIYGKLQLICNQYVAG